MNLYFMMKLIILSRSYFNYNIILYNISVAFLRSEYYHKIKVTRKTTFSRAFRISSDFSNIFHYYNCIKGRICQ